MQATAEPGSGIVTRDVNLPMSIFFVMLLLVLAEVVARLFSFTMLFELMEELCIRRQSQGT